MPIDAAELAAGLAADPTFKQLQAGMNDMGKLVRGMVTIQQQQTAVLNDVRTKLSTAPNAQNEPNKDGDDGDDGEVDVNSLDNAGFQKFLMKGVGKLLDEKFGQIGQKIDGVSSEFRTDKLRSQYKDIKETNLDFDDWADEMQALAKENPGLNLKQLYTLARSENETKAKELDAKYAKTKDGEKAKEDHTLTLFGGYRPTIGKTDGDQSGKKAEKLTAEEAGAKAWEETVSRFPGLASLETNPLD